MIAKGNLEPYAQLPSIRHGRLQRGSCRAQATVEAAIVIVVFLTLLFGVLDFGYCLYCYDFVSTGAKLATRYAVVHGAKSSNPAKAADLQSVVTAQSGGLDPAQLTVNSSWNPDNNPGSTVSVNVSYNFHFLTSFLPSQTVALTANSQGIISQ